MMWFKLNFLAIYSLNLNKLVEIQRVPSYGYPIIPKRLFLKIFLQMQNISNISSSYQKPFTSKVIFKSYETYLYGPWVL